MIDFSSQLGSMTLGFEGESKGFLASGAGGFLQLISQSQWLIFSSLMIGVRGLKYYMNSEGYSSRCYAI